jgi:hypothetical protein
MFTHNTVYTHSFIDDLSKYSLDIQYTRKVHYQSDKETHVVLGHRLFINISLYNKIGMFESMFWQPRHNDKSGGQVMKVRRHLDMS